MVTLRQSTSTKFSGLSGLVFSVLKVHSGRLRAARLVGSREPSSEGLHGLSRFLNDGSRILVITQRHKLGMTKPIGSRPLQEFHRTTASGRNQTHFFIFSAVNSSTQKSYPNFLGGGQK